MLAIPKTRHPMAVAFAALVFGGLGLAMPWLIDGSDSEIAFRSATLNAAPRDSFTLSSPVPFEVMPRVRLERGSVAVAPSSGAPTSGAAVLAMLTGGKARLVLDNAVLSLDLGARAVSPAGAGQGGLEPVLAALVGLSFSELTIRDSQLRVTRADGSIESLTLAHALVTRQRNGRIKTVANVVLRGERLAIDLALSPAVETGGATAWPLTLDVHNDLVHINASGNVTTRDSLQFNAPEAEFEVASIRRLARWLGAEWGDGRGLEQLRIKGPLEWTPRALAFPQATVDIDGNSASGTLTAKLANQRASIEGTLDFEKLDVAAYLDQAAATSSQFVFDLTSYLPPSLAFKPAFPILKDVDADLRLSASKVTVGDTAYGKGAASLSLKNGVMLADIAEFEIGKGGTCSGQLSIDAAGVTPQYRLKGKLDAADVALVSEALLAYPAVGGIGTTTVDLSASGLTRQSLVQSLSGKIGVRLPQFGQLGVDLNALAATTRAAAQKGWAGTSRGQTSINSLAADFNVLDGRMNVGKATARTGDATLTAVGSIDLQSGHSDMRVWMTRSLIVPAPSDALPPGSPPAPAIAAATSGVGLLIEGPINAPTIRYLPVAGSSESTTGGSPPPAIAPSPRSPPDRG